MTNFSIHHEIAGLTIELREAKDSISAARVRVEKAAIDEAGGIKAIGANEDERQRNLALALANDRNYLEHMRFMRLIEAKLNEKEADLATYQDERRTEEWRIRARLADVLSSTTPNLDEPADDSVQDASVASLAHVRATTLSTGIAAPPVSRKAAAAILVAIAAALTEIPEGMRELTMPQFDHLADEVNATQPEEDRANPLL